MSFSINKIGQEEYNTALANASAAYDMITSHSSMRCITFYDCANLLEQTQEEDLQQQTEEEESLSLDQPIDDFGNTALIHAIANENAALMCKYLIEQKASVDQGNFYGATPLICAVTNLKEDCVQLFLDCKASTSVPDSDGSDLLMLAIENEAVECAEKVSRIIQLLLKSGIDITHKNYNGETAFDLAISKGYSRSAQEIAKQIAQELIDKKLEIKTFNQCSEDCEQKAQEESLDEVDCLVEAVCKLDKERVQQLLDKNVTPRIMNKNGSSLPMLVIERGMSKFSNEMNDNALQIMKLLIENKVDLARQDNNGQTALMQAIRWTGATELLLEQEGSEKWLPLKNNWGQTAFDLALLKGCRNSAQKILEKIVYKIGEKKLEIVKRG